MKFAKRYDENYDPKKNYVIMDDDSLTEQQGYKTNSQLYEEMVRSGKILAAHNLGMTYEDYLEHEDEEPFETRYELDITEQEEILENFKKRYQEAVEKAKNQQQSESADLQSEPVKKTVSKNETAGKDDS